MNHRTKDIFIGLSFIIGLSAILKFYFEIPYIGILFLVLLGTSSGLATALIRGFINPPSWLYRIRFTVLAVFYGISISILDFGMEVIEKKTFIVRDLLVYIVIGLVLSLLFSMMFKLSQKFKKRNGLLLPERQLVKDSALLMKQNGEKIRGELVLTNDHLIFLGNGKEVKLEKEVSQIYPGISKTKFLGIPDGFSLENDDILKVSFPYYWLKSINKIKTTA